jgi:hypothetical protein
MQLSVIISILNSHEIVRRQMLHWHRIGIPDGVEVLYLDDGSDPPLVSTHPKVQIVPTNNPRCADRSDGRFVDGRVGMARNLGARIAQGEFVIMTDIDYIIGRDSIDAGLNLQHDKQGFRRQFGVLDENGVPTQDMAVLRQWGLLEHRIQTRGTFMAPHPNNFIIRRSVFLELGGYREDRVGNLYPDGHDRWFKRDWMTAYRAGKYTISPTRTTLLMFPNGQYCGDVDANPFGMFHDLKRKNERWPPPE